MRMPRLSLIGLKVSSLGSLLTLGILWAMAATLLRQAEHSLVGSLELRAQAYGHAAREAMFPQPDVFALHFATQSQLKEAAVASAAVVDASGRVLSHTDSSRIGGREPAPRLKESVVVPHDGGYLITVPISAGDKQLGLVRLAVTRFSLARALGGARHQILLLACLAAFLNLAGVTALVGWLMRPLRRLAEAATAVGDGTLDVSVKHETRDELGRLAAAFNKMAGGLREREKMRALFGKFVPPAVVESLLAKGPAALEGRKCEVTVLMADIRDFTTLSETLAPEELLTFLNDYFARMVEIIVRNGGVVDKFMGDGILAVFGAPVAVEDHAARAAACALEMHFCLERFNAERIRSGLVPIRFGVALNTGSAVAGMVGSKDKLEYTVVGDVVNTVSRLEGLNSKFGTELLVTETTYKLTRGLFAYEALGRVCVRGRQQPVGVYQLLGPEGALSSARETAAILGPDFGDREPLPAVMPPLTARRGPKTAKAA
jgi:class 3 adenylate cyclase